MTLILLALLGALAGLLANQVMLREQGQNTTTLNVLAGALGAAVGGWLMLYTGGTQAVLAACLGAALGAGLLLSIVNLVRRRGIP